jgi:hypothetical protein
VPRSFLQPGLRLKLHPDDTYAYGLNRGGIDERWFASTTATANEGRAADEGLSYVRRRQATFTLAQAVEDCGATWSANPSGRSTASGPCTRSSSTTWGRSRTTCTRAPKQAKLVGQEGKPESYYFPPQHNNVGNNFPYTFMGFEPGTTKAQVRKCLRNWNKGDNGILDLSKAYRLKPAPAGSSIPASSTPRDPSAPTSRSGAPTSSACTRTSSRAAKCRGRCS